MKRMQSLMTGFALAAGVGLLSGTAYSAGRPPGLPDGTVEAGVSPDTEKTMYTTPEDAPGFYTFDQAKTYCAGLTVNGKDDWRVPTKNELNVLFQNRAAIGGFDETGAYPTGWYWVVQGHDLSVWISAFATGFRIGTARTTSRPGDWFVK